MPGDGTEDLALLRSFEPVVRYTEGELFFPTCMRAYVAQCSLWAGGRADDRGDVESLLVPAGTLTLDKLCDAARTTRDRPLTLRFVQASMDRAAYRRWRREDRPWLRAEGRFTKGGVLARLIDGLLRLSTPAATVAPPAVSRGPLCQPVAPRGAAFRAWVRGHRRLSTDEITSL